MEVVNLIQGSDEWLAFRKENLPASEAPAMMNASKFDPKSPGELVLFRSGEKKLEINSFLAGIFAEGHAMEDACRPIIEKILNEQFAPTTGRIEVAGLKKCLSSSFDGITFDSDIAFEHKKWNTGLAEQVKKGVLEPHYFWQLEQQLLVSGASYVVFVTSDAFILDTGEDPTKFPYYAEVTPFGSSVKQYVAANHLEYMQYKPQQGRAKELVEGWAKYEEIEHKMNTQPLRLELKGFKIKGISDKISSLKVQLKELERELKACQNEVVGAVKKAELEYASNGGLEVAKKVRRGSVDPNKILEAIGNAIETADNDAILEFLKAESLDDFRKESTESWSVKVIKDAYKMTA